MKCDRCGKNEANVHMKNIINGKIIEYNICEECAKKDEGIGFKELSFKSFATSLMEILHSLENQVPEEKSIKKDEKKCEKCGMDYSEIKATGYLGCDNCYNTYRDELKSIIRSINGSSKHQGKMPRRFLEKKEKLTEVQKKELELNKAIEEENYERAACLRDEIKSLKQIGKEE